MFRVVALPFAVPAIGGTATDIGLVEAAGLVPLAVLVLVGGVWADRLPRRSVMLVADLARMALQLAAAALLIAGIADVWHLAALQVGMGVAEAFFGPSCTGLVPRGRSRCSAPSSRDACVRGRPHVGASRPLP